MTREEIIKELSEMRTDAWTDSRQMEALAEGIKAIKAIEDIKAEIAYLRDAWRKDRYDDEADALSTVLMIINRYTGGNAGEKN